MRSWTSALAASCAVVCAICTVCARADAQSPPDAPTRIALGDWQLSPLVELRSRAEYRHAPVDLGGAGSATVSDAVVGLQRSRLGALAEHGALAVKLTLQDARAWGAVPPTATLPSGQPNGQTGAYEAYIEMRTDAAHASFLRVGRQAVTWGEGRLLSDADWSPAGRSLDAVRARLALGDLDVEALGALLESRRPLGTAFEDTTGPASGGEELAGALVRYAVDPLFKVEAYTLARLTESGAYSPGASRFSYARAAGETYVGSLHVFGDGRGWRYGIEGAYEIGRATELSAQRQAYAAAAHVARTFDMLLLSPTLRLGASYASGDDGSGTYKQFDPLLPDVHAWHGMMDVFAWSNAEELSGRLSIVPFIDASLALEYRFVAMPEPSADWLNGYLGVVGRAPGNASADLGHEIDLSFAWRPWTVMEVAAGYSALLLGDGARTIMAAEQRGTPGGTPAAPATTPASLSHFAYAQIAVHVP